GHENFGVAPVNFIGSGFGSGVVSAIGSVACSVAGGVSIAVSIADVAGTADDDEGGGARSSSTIVPLALEWILLPDPVSVVVIGEVALPSATGARSSTAKRLSYASATIGAALSSGCCCDCGILNFCPRYRMIGFLRLFSAISALRSKPKARAMLS